MKDLHRGTLLFGFALEAAHKGKATPYTAEKIKELYNQNKRDYIEGYFKIYVHPKCENTIVELSNYVWDTKEGNVINKPIDDYNHLMDALRYSLEDVRLGGIKFDRNRFNL